MDVNGYISLFVSSKKKMTLEQASGYIRRILDSEYPMIPKTWKVFRYDYNRRLAQRVVCEEVIEALRNAAPWEDYREIFAKLEWPFMKRATRYLFDNHRYRQHDGKKRGEADVWFIDMWEAYHELFCKMPGELPDIRPWQMYEVLLMQAKQHRRKL